MTRADGKPEQRRDGWMYEGRAERYSCMSATGHGVHDVIVGCPPDIAIWFLVLGATVKEGALGSY